MALWYFGENGQQHGPVDDAGIRQAIAAGQLNLQTLVWREGMPNWLPLAQVPELFHFDPGNPFPGSPDQPHYPMPYGSMPPPTSGLAIASMVCGIVAPCLCHLAIVPAIPAVICGHLAMTRIREDPLIPGRGMALAGLILGYIFIALTIFVAAAAAFAIISDL
jgi:hypothetical protein